MPDDRSAARALAAERAAVIRACWTCDPADLWSPRRWFAVSAKDAPSPSSEQRIRWQPGDARGSTATAESPTGATGDRTTDLAVTSGLAVQEAMVNGAIIMEPRPEP